jgi:acyl dehydratase
MSYISEMLTKLFRDGWRRGGKINVAFIGPVYPGDTISSSAIVKEKVPEGQRQRLVLEVWSENQAGRRVTVGTASGLVR